MDPYANTAVDIRNASKSFGKKPVLNNLNMHVEKGIIYGLLGSSGCGKTTLLNCIVGRRRLDSGTVWVLGGSPGSKESGIPGPRVGYMPQDIALVAEFTVKSAIYYFGRLFLMNDDEIERKLEELTSLLDLPPADRLISNCSGGQQRRVSFAAALVSTPELLVLDEPTVGLDPILREGIWNYLLKLTCTNLTSVIITTHYIEEARQAHKIGLMRHGRLLAEESPTNLLEQFQTNSLEDIFLTLSTKDSQNFAASRKRSNINMSETHFNSSTAVLSEPDKSQEVLSPKTKKKSKPTYSTANGYSLNMYRLRALLGKSWLQVSRNYSGCGFMFIFPIIQTVAFFVAIGEEVKDIKIAINNHEDNFGSCENYMKNSSAIPNEDGGCEFERLGCRFLEELNDPMIDKVFYDDISKAREAVQHGEVTGALYIPENFSVSFHEKLIDGAYDDPTLNSSQIQVWLDMSNRLVGAEIKYKLTDNIIDFQKSLFSSCNFSNDNAKAPINFDGHMYGNLDDGFIVFMAPAIILTSLYFMGASNAASIMLTDRLEGIWDRSIVAGVSTIEIVIAHFLTQIIIAIIQNALMLVIFFPVYQIENAGSTIAVAIISLLAGVCGISFGFFISVVSNGHSMSHIMTTGGFFPLILLCGLMWPIEAMPIFLQWISVCLPITLATLSLRNIMRKGWSIFHKDVISGVGVETFWIILFVVISILEIKRRR